MVTGLRILMVLACVAGVSCDQSTDDSALPCEYNGQRFGEGTSVPAGDDCNTCTCFESQVVCTEAACLGDAGLTDAMACDYMGQPVAEGEVVPAGDGCNRCGCIGGSMTCTEESCADDAPPDA